MPNFIDKETHEQANQMLPDINQVIMRIACLKPDIISTKFPPNSNFSIAGACFQDAGRTLVEARYAMLESFTHKIWYRDKIDPPDTYAAVFFSRFYADDTALRLYSAAEHLAKAVVYIFDIAGKKIKAINATSRFTKVRQILNNEQQTHPIAIAMDELHNSSNWKEMIAYRNDWIHQQPPIIEGLGWAYKREQRWRKSAIDKSYKLGIGSGDEAKYSVDDLHNFILPALFQFTGKLAQISNFYIAELEKRGFTITETETGLQTRFL